jgi:hypothetical protein
MERVKLATELFSILHYVHRAEPVLGSWYLLKQSNNSPQHFTNPDVSLLLSENSSTFPYPEPDKSIPHYHILLLMTVFVILQSKSVPSKL